MTRRFVLRVRQPSVDHYTMPASPASYAVTGVASSLLKGSRIIASAGSHLWTGTNATLTRAGGGGATLLWGANPRTLSWTRGSPATGTSVAALQDGGLFDNVQCGDLDVMQIVTGASVSWPYGNVARLVIPSVNSHCRGPEITAAQGIPNLPTAQTLCFSFMLGVVTVPTTTDTLCDHPVRIPQVGGGQLTLVRMVHGIAGTSFRVGFDCDHVAGTGSSPEDLNWGTPVRLNIGRYLYMIKLVWPNGITGGGADVRVLPRIYSSTGTLIHDASTFIRIPLGQGGSPTQTLAEWHTAGGLHRFTTLSGLTFGMGDPGAFNYPVGFAWEYANPEIWSDYPTPYTW